MFIINFFKYLNFFFKKLFFFLKYKKFIFLIKFITTEMLRIYERYFIKNFSHEFYLSSQNYTNNDFITHNINTQKWFKHNIIYMISMIKKFDLNLIKNDILEIGSYEGNSAIFFLQNIKNSNITCVDIWSDEYTSGNKNRSLKFSDIKKNFDQNLARYNDRLTTHHSTSDNFFKKNKTKFDLIYIDASHTYENVLRDGKNAINVLNHNGLIIFDDLFKDEVFAAVCKIHKENINLKLEYVYHQAIFRYKKNYKPSSQ